MIEVEIVDIHVAKPCPKCGVLPVTGRPSGWYVAKCPKCLMSVRISFGNTNDVIGEWNRKVDEDLCI